jgi:hypothetical protein
MTILFLMLISFVCGAGAATAVFRSRLREQSEASAELERAVVRAAMLRGGRITALDVRPPRDWGLADVERELRRMHGAGYCESDLSSEGHAIYVFPEFDDSGQRARKLESEILQMARTHRGLVDVSKVAAETELTYVEARRMLDELARQGICEPTESADTYRFFARRQLGG